MLSGGDLRLSFLKATMLGDVEVCIGDREPRANPCFFFLVFFFLKKTTKKKTWSCLATVTNRNVSELLDGGVFVL